MADFSLYGIHQSDHTNSLHPALVLVGQYQAHMNC